MISEFLDEQILNHDQRYREEFRRPLSATNKRHDLIAITLNDPREKHLPQSGLLHLHDAENKKRKLIDASHQPTRQRYTASYENRSKLRQQLFRSVGMDYIDVSTDVPYADAFIKFFLKRKRRAH